MNRLLAVLFPEKADATIRGSKLPFWVFVMIASIGTVRSLIHILSPDGGAGSIAGMDVATTGANGIVLAFAHTPPGAIQNYVYLPLAALMLALSLWSGFKSTTSQQAAEVCWFYKEVIKGGFHTITMIFNMSAASRGV